MPATRQELMESTQEAHGHAREAEARLGTAIRQLEQLRQELKIARAQLALVMEDRDRLTATVECLARRLASPHVQECSTR